MIISVLVLIVLTTGSPVQVCTDRKVPSSSREKHVTESGYPANKMLNGNGWATNGGGWAKIAWLSNQAMKDWSGLETPDLNQYLTLHM